VAASLVAAKLQIPQAHVESGLRSFRRSIPEEVNRLVSDHLADLLFYPSATALQNLKREGLEDRAVLSGDVMYDAALLFQGPAERTGGDLAETWKPRQFALATVHRAENTDDPVRLAAILEALEEVSTTLCPVVLPLHPRTRVRLQQLGWEPRRLKLIEPLSYLQMLLLESRARIVITDSGGVQKEAYFMRVPCITLRAETEWTETLANGCNQLAGTDRAAILAAVRQTESSGPWNTPYGDGHAAEKIVETLRERAR
jgi:UDP-GlcNAc3NAcA epimerase